MIEANHEKLSIRRQCELLSVPRSTVYYKSVQRAEDADIQKEIYRVWVKHPFYGYRKIYERLRKDRPGLSQHEVRRTMRLMNIQAIYPKRNLSVPGKGHKIYPYLLNGVEISSPNLVWASDISYTKVSGAMVFIVAIIDLYSRKVLSWRVSNTMHRSFCVDALREALVCYGVPQIFNTDQGSQFTSEEFVRELKENHINISMDGKGRVLDNVYVERLWRSLKYENIHLNDYGSLTELRRGVEEYFRFFNTERPHQSFDYRTPDEIYYETCGKTINKGA